MCTDFAVVTTNHETKKTEVHIGRTFDVWFPYHYIFKAYPAGIEWVSEAPEGCTPAKWASKYPFQAIEISGFDEKLLIDGTSKTLSVALSSLKGTLYNLVKAEDTALLIRDIASWILGNFQTIDEVKEGLKKVKVWGKYVPLFNIDPGMHIALHEFIEGQEPKHAVIEFIKGKTKVIDNPVKVVTDGPKFSRHINNLGRYKGVDPIAAGEKQYGTLTVVGNELGTKMPYPGGDSSADRFIRVALMVNNTEKIVTTTERAEVLTVDTIGHAFRDLTVPLGDDKKGARQYTQWAIVKNMAAKTFRIKVYVKGNYTRPIHSSEIPEEGVRLSELYTSH